MLLTDFEKKLDEYIERLENNEQSRNTVIKYRGNISAFIGYLKTHCGEEINKDLFSDYKQYLIDEDYKKTSINSYIIAINKYLRYLGLDDFCVKVLKMQQNTSIENVIELPEYRKLVDFLSKKRNRTTYLIVRTLASTGIRVGELRFLTVDALKDGGCMEVTNKNKTRQVLFPDGITRELLEYCNEKEIHDGIVFYGKDHTKGLHPSSIWRRLKTAAIQAQIDENKTFPHNLRHLFAKTYLETYGNIFDLADLLGHESINTTRIYNRKSKGERREKLNQMGL